MKQLLFLISLLICVTAAHADKVYKWTDENGQVHYSTFPPAQADAEDIRVPSANPSTSSSGSGSGTYNGYKKSYRRDRASGSAQERRRTYEELKEEREAEEYDRKYGAKARLKRVEEEKRRKEMHSEQVYRERIRAMEQEKKDKEFEEKWKQFVDKVQGLKGECEAARGTDCDNPEYLNRWARKKYAPKK